MNCEEFARQSEEWMEGRRTAEARTHAMACERCRAFVEDLDQIRLLAPELSLDVEPPDHLWKHIHSQLKKEGLIQQPAWTHAAAQWVSVARRPLFAAAAALALALLTFTVSMRPTRPAAPATGPMWLSADQTELVSVDTQLDHVERGTIGSLGTSDPMVQNTLRQNLLIVDRQIARCEKTLEEAPSDEYTRDYLFDAYQQKADLLNMMAERSSDPIE